MSRPEVSVVMPFAGDLAAAHAAARALLALDTEPGDQLILVDNSGVPLDVPQITVVKATGERSPAHARNVGAEHARHQWILFLDADSRARGQLIGAYFAREIPADVGGVAGEVVSATDTDTLAARYGAARNFLSQQTHLEHPYRPRAVAANLLVRRAAFEQVGGFYEGLRAAEDTDFSWRLQEAGWRLLLRPEASVEHHYRATVRELRSQWRAYAAGRAWLARRYEGFEPEPAVRRALVRAWNRLRQEPTRARGAPTTDARPLERGRYLVLDALLSAEELAGLALSNRPPRLGTGGKAGPVDVVLVADLFPARGDPLVELARTLERTRVEAARRPDAPDLVVTRELAINYREDDGVGVRAFSLALLLGRHPTRCTLEVIRQRSGEPSLLALAPAVRRLERDQGARVHPLGGEEARATARRIARLSGRPVVDIPRDQRPQGRWARGAIRR